MIRVAKRQRQKKGHKCPYMQRWAGWAAKVLGTHPTPQIAIKSKVLKSSARGANFSRIYVAFCRFVSRACR